MKIKQLSAREVATAKPPEGKHRVYILDGGGLFLQVTKTKGRDGKDSFHRSWVFRYSSPVFRNKKGQGQVRDMGLGPIETRSLARARELATSYREQVADGLDPILERQKQRNEARKLSADTMLFRDAVKRFLELHLPTWNNPKHRQQWENTLAKHAVPKLGDRAVASIDVAAITEALAPIWHKTPETGQRVKQRIERVCQWVKDGMPPPNGSATKRVKHHAALPFKDMPDFMAELRANQSLSARVLEFTILTASRTSEVINAKWDEFENLDGIEPRWVVPADRMKMGKEHIVPLSKRAAAIINELLRDNSGFVFFGARAGKPLSNMAMLELLRGMRGKGLTVHGFRSTFRDWAGEETEHSSETIEFALAHGIPDKAKAAYRRYRATGKRRQLMNDWAQYCEAPAKENVIRLKSA